MICSENGESNPFYHRQPRLGEAIITISWIPGAELAHGIILTLVVPAHLTPLSIFVAVTLYWPALVSLFRGNSHRPLASVLHCLCRASTDIVNPDLSVVAFMLESRITFTSTFNFDVQSALLGCPDVGINESIINDNPIIAINDFGFMYIHLIILNSNEILRCVSLFNWVF